MPVLRLIKSRVSVISNCAVCGVSDFKPTVLGEQNYLWTLYCVVVYCNAELTVPHCPPPYGQELKEMCGKKLPLLLTSTIHSFGK